MAKLELDVIYSMNTEYKDAREITWREIDINEAYKISCEIVADAKPDISPIIANSQMSDIWIYDDDGDIKAHWYFHDDFDGWVF